MVDEDAVREWFEKNKRRGQAFRGSQFYQGYLKGQEDFLELILEYPLIEKK